MSVTLTEERLPDLRPGMKVKVTKTIDGELYMVRGILIGFELHADGPTVRVLGEDGLERKVRMPARVVADA